MNQSELCAQTTAAALERAITLCPDVEAIVGPDGRVTYAELGARVAEIRAALVAAGVQHSDHVGLCAGNGVRWVALFLAISSLGAVTVPINTRFRTDEITYALRQSRVRTLFVVDKLLNVEFIPMLRAICPGIDNAAAALPDPALPDLHKIIVIGADVPAGAQGWDDFMAGGRSLSAPPPVNCAPDDILLMQYTSGTTSFPKGVMLPHSNMLTNGFVVGGRMGLRAADRYHSARPFFHVSGTTLSILAAIHHCATLVTMERFEPAEALRLLEEERCTHISGNDTMVLMLLNHPDRKTRKLHLRGGWAAATPSVMRRFMHELGAREAVGTYGLSETSPNISVGCWWEPEELRLHSMRLQPGIELRIRNTETGEDCAIGETGEILVRGWIVMRGYFDKPEETRATIDADGWLATGDLGVQPSEGRLTFAGRAKDILRVGGENVSPVEVEDFLHRHPKIRHAQAVGVPDARLVEVVAAVVVLNDGEQAEPEELLEWARGQMAGFKAPRYLMIIDDFESVGMTASSKVKRKDLAAFAARAFGLAPAEGQT